MRPWAFVAVLLLMLSGCTRFGGGDDGGREPLPPEWRGRDLREPGWANETIQAGWTLALESDWSSGKRVDWDWVVIAPVQQRDPVFTAFVHFQLVRMEGGQGQPLVAQDAQEGEGDRTIVQSGTHQIDWMNEWTQPVTVAYKVTPGGRHILYPPGEGPGCLTGRSTGSAACLRSPLGG